jgi:bacillithiol system protein YtxJ
MWRWTRQAEPDPVVEIGTDADLADWLGREGANLLFLNDPFCPISGHAYREVSRLPAPIGLLDVAAAPHLSAAVEARTGVRHESPQILLLRDGRVIWTASHFRVTADGVREALDSSANAAAEAGFAPQE